MLYVQKARLEDRGTYTCECRNAVGGSNKEHHLEVHGEPGTPETERMCTGGCRWHDLSTRGPTGSKSSQPLPAALEVLERMFNSWASFAPPACLWAPSWLSWFSFCTSCTH